MFLSRVNEFITLKESEGVLSQAEISNINSVITSLDDNLKYSKTNYTQYSAIRKSN